MFGLTIDKLLVILLIAIFVVGPERLPHYAKKLGDLVRSVKRVADGAKGRLREEMGPEFEDVDWKQLDPRQYDPRRIIRDALLEDEKSAVAGSTAARAARARAAREAATSITPVVTEGDAAVDTSAGEETAGLRYDDEAT